MTAATALALAYLLVSLPTPGVAGTVWSNAVGIFGFALFPRALASFLRRLGRTADSSRALAAEAAQRAERDRQRRLLHDHETVMRMLADPDTDPALIQLLRQQAISGANQVRHFLQTVPGSAGARPERLLVALLSAAAAEFPDLPIQLSVDLARDVTLSQPQAAAVGSALRTLLHNVRKHAHATNVVVHADTRDGGWEISVRDDGVGFDPGTTPRGFGLREQVHAHLAEHGIATTIESEPGEGTAVMLCWQQRAGANRDPH